MASTDATAVPVKNQAYRVTLPILDADGDLVTGATAPDSEVSKDGGAFADATNEITEIATASGMYFLDLTATEMNADTVSVIVKTTSTGAKTTPIVMYPNEVGDIDVDVTAFGGTAGTFAAGRPEVNTTHAAGTAWGSGAITAASIATDAFTAAKFAADVTTELRALASGTSDSGTTTTMVDAARTEADNDWWKGNLILFTSGTVAGQCRLITAFTAATDTITFAPATTAAVSTQTYEILPAGRADVQLWLGSVANALIAGRVDSDVGAMQAGVVTAAAIAAGAITAAKFAADAIDGTALAATAVDEIWAKAMTEIGAVPAVTASTLDAIRWMFALSRNKITQTATTQLLRNDADAATLGTSTVSDDGTTAIRGKFA